jgi:hypothetical protein
MPVHCCTPAGIVATFTQSVQKIPPASGLAMKQALAVPVDVFITHAMLAVLVPAVPAWTICHVPTGAFSSPAAGIAAAVRTRATAVTNVGLIGLSPFAIWGGDRAAAGMGKWDEAGNMRPFGLADPRTAGSRWF